MLVHNKQLRTYGAVMATSYLIDNIEPRCHKVIDGYLRSMFSSEDIREMIGRKYTLPISDHSRGKMVKTTNTILYALERIERE